MLPRPLPRYDRCALKDDHWQANIITQFQEWFDAIPHDEDKLAYVYELVCKNWETHILY